MNSQGISKGWGVVIQSWEQAEGQNVQLSEHNFNVLKSALQQAIANGIQPSPENWRAVVDSVMSRLQLVHQLVEDPADHLPYADDHALRNIRSLEDIAKLTKEQYAMVLQPAARDSGLTQRFNERIAYIQQHRIHAKPSAKAETTVKQPVEDPQITKARRLVTNISQKDIGSANSETGRFVVAAAAKRRIGNMLAALVAKRVPPASILSAIQLEIGKLGSASIR